MAGNVVFSKTSDGQDFTNGMFEVIFIGLYDRYLDQPAVPILSRELLMILGRQLHDSWPEKYPEPRDWHGVRILESKEIPLVELREWLRALTEFLSDARKGDIDPDLELREGREAFLVTNLEQMATLLRHEISVLSTLARS